MKKVLIFGVSGFVGPYLAREMQTHGYTVVGSDMAEKKIQGVDFIQADLLSAEAVENIIVKTKPDAIINLAGISSVGHSWNIPQTTMEVNVTGALNIMEAVRRNNLPARILLIGSSEEYQASSKPMDENTPLDSNNPYGISKMAQEKFAQMYREHYGMKIYNVRPFNHTGIGQRDTFVLPSFCKQVAQIEVSGKPGIMSVGNVDVKRDFSDVRDIVRAYRMIIESDNCNSVFNVGTGKCHTLRDLLQHIISYGKQPIEIRVDPSKIRPAETMEVCCDYGFIHKELGWEPQHNIYDTLREMYEYYLNTVH